MKFVRIISSTCSSILTVDYDPLSLRNCDNFPLKFTLRTTIVIFVTIQEPTV